uniref:Importin 4 n=1 Tax=Oryzias sinensis TaxID=183150 RepID=A0A8C7WYJ5_9TELE
MQIRQTATVTLRLKVKKHWKKINPNDRERLQIVMVMLPFCIIIFSKNLRSKHQPLPTHGESETQSKLDLKTLFFFPQVGLLLLNKVIESNPESFQPHYFQLLQLLSTVLHDHNNPIALYYCILTLTEITAFIAYDCLQKQMRSIIPDLIVALKHLIKANEQQATEAMEVFIELMEIEVSVIVPHVAGIVHFCLEVASDTTLSDSLRVKALSCITFLIKLRSKSVLKLKLLTPILKALFPILTAAPPLGEHDPEDEEDGDSDDNATDNANPKHCAAQVIDTMALHMPPEKLFHHLVSALFSCLSSEDPYQKKGGLMCLAVLAEGCADHIRTNMLSSVLQTVCRSLSDSSQVVRSAALFALGQFSEHLQPEVSKYCSELMPLLLGYLSSLNEAKVGHVTRAFYALENFMENLGADIEPYLPTLMETMLSALGNTNKLKIKELAVSAIGAIANAAKESLVPYFPPIIESLKGFLIATTEEMRSLQTQSLDTLSVLARTIGKDVFSPLAAECIQLGMNLTDNIDDPDLRRCTYSLYSSVATICPESLTPHLTAITTVMLLALKSTEGITDKNFVLLDDNDDDDTDKGAEHLLEDEPETDILESAGFSVENAYMDEKEDACDALGEIAFSTGVAFQPFLESSFQQVYEMRDFPHEDVRRAALGAMGQFCRAQHKVFYCFKKNNFFLFFFFLRHVVMGVLESMNSVVKSCKEEVFKNPSYLREICSVIREVLTKKTPCQGGDPDDTDDEDQQAEFDAMLQEFAGEGIPLLASSVPADQFAPFLNDLLPLIMSKTKSSCTVADRSFSIGTIGEILQALVNAPGGRGLAGRLSNRLLPVLVAGVKDSDAEVRNNSVFGLGCLAEAAGPIVVSYPHLYISTLSHVCSARQVVPALVKHLPLKEDMEENKTVFKCLVMLYKHSPDMVQCKLLTPSFNPLWDRFCLSDT